VVVVTVVVACVVEREVDVDVLEVGMIIAVVEVVGEVVVIEVDVVVELTQDTKSKDVIKRKVRNTRIISLFM
jgi:hypothetical protein